MTQIYAFIFGADLGVLSAKFKAASSTLGILLAVEATPTVTTTPVPAWLDLGVTISAIALLGYILRLVFSGNLVSRELVENISEKAVRDTLREVKKNESQ